MKSFSIYQKLAIVPAVCALALVGCGKKENTTPDKEPQKQSQVAQDTEKLPDDVQERVEKEEKTPVPEGFTEGNTQSPTFPHAQTAGALLKTSRMAGHDGWDRMVVEYNGPNGFAWAANWVDVATQDGSGKPVTIKGNKVLEVTVAGVSIPDDPNTIPNMQPASLGGAKAVQEMIVGLPFEANHKIFIGADKERPYKISVFEHPSRMVIDIDNR